MVRRLRLYRCGGCGLYHAVPDGHALPTCCGALQPAGQVDINETPLEADIRREALKITYDLRTFHPWVDQRGCERVMARAADYIERYQAIASGRPPARAIYRAGIYECGACDHPVEVGDLYCRHCGRGVQ